MHAVDKELPVIDSYKKALGFARGLVTGSRLSIAIVGSWFAVIGYAIWSYAAAEVEPPLWDPGSYAAKAFYFWQAVRERHLFNPLSLPPAVRPPGTILMSYPFGFSHAFNAFYFRSVYFPLILLAAAVYIGCHDRGVAGPALPSWVIAVVALALCGMPVFYQFQPGFLPATNFWGLVDAFIASVAAVAAAAAVRSVRTLSVGWAIVAAVAAALCLMIKPAGGLVMLLVGATWLILAGSAFGGNPRLLWREPAQRRFALISIVSATIIYGSAFGAAFKSEYLSADSINWGMRAVAVLHKDFPARPSLGAIWHLTVMSFGYIATAPSSELD